MIPETPELRLFLDAYAQQKAPLSIFVGAGLSAPANLPTWRQLERDLRLDVDQKIGSMNKIGSSIYESQYKALKKSDDLWIKFKLIKSILTEPTFNGLVEKYLSANEDDKIPSGYINLLKLEPKGFVTLNLDRFAGDAVTSLGNKFSNPVYGMELATKWNTLLEEKPHLVYLHGDILNPSTWVLTKDDLDILTNSKAHEAFLLNKYLNNIVLFAGISLDDLALSSKIIELRESGMRPRNLFWLTNRSDELTREWAARNYIKIITYSAESNDDHQRAIEEFVTKSKRFRPVEVTPELVDNARFSEITTADPQSILQKAPDEIRKHISAKVDQIINQADESIIYDLYRKFCKEYHFAIHQSFYRNNVDGFSNWFGYNLDFPARGRGNFGEVYSATDNEGNLFAIKIMHESAFNSDEMLGGFRRGVRSMRFVSDSGVKGMVSLHEAFELPPTIVMPFVHGVNLQEAVEQRKDLPWEVKIRIVRHVADIVSNAHALPSTVLHRDLKPSNVMVSNFEHHGSFDPEIVVLDFDMSWHKGAMEKDVVFESRDDFGYLAPEQTVFGTGYHARTTKVDSYGLGMSIFFLFGHEAPLANEPLNPDWSRRVLRAVSRNYRGSWKSAPQRLTRLIVSATKIDQLERSDFFSLKYQISTVERAVNRVEDLRDVEVWGEEILARIGSQIPYYWDDVAGGGFIETPAGLRLELKSDAKEQRIDLEVTYHVPGHIERSAIPLILKNMVEGCKNRLLESGWSHVSGEEMKSAMTASAFVSIDDILKDEDIINGVSDLFKFLQR